MPPVRHLAAILFWFCALSFVAWFATPRLFNADLALYRAAAERSDEPLRLLLPGEGPRTFKVLTPHRVPEYPPVYCTVWDSDLDESPTPDPKIQELATILHCLSSRHAIHHVALSSPLTWLDEDNETVHLMLDNALGSLKHLSVGLQAHNAAQAQVTPQHLKDSAIPPDHLEGDPSGIPTANMARPYHLPHRVDDSVGPAPDFVEDELLSREEADARGLSLPLLVRWNDDVLPTLPLSMVMHYLGITTADLHVHFGRYLQLGDRTLPLDAHGRTPLGAARAELLPLQEALHPTVNAPQSSSSAGKIAVLFRPSLTNTPANRGELIAASISCLLAQDHTTYMPGTRTEQAHFLRLTPLQASPIGLAILALLTLFALIFLPRISLLLRLTLMVAGLAGIWLLAWLSYRSGLWISLSSWLLCWLLLFLALSALAPRRLPPPPPTLWD